MKRQMAGFTKYWVEVASQIPHSSMIESFNDPISPYVWWCWSGTSQTVRSDETLMESCHFPVSVMRLVSATARRFGADGEARLSTSTGSADDHERALVRLQD
jgi:hypothetical protein